jgi:hypothetical protein
MPPYLLQRAPDPVNPRPPASVGSSRAARAQDHPDVRAVIPRRSALPVDRGVLIVAHATHKQKALFFFLVQARPRTRTPSAASAAEPPPGAPARAALVLTCLL